MNPNPKKGKMKTEGSVLFTIVTVMGVMVVFLMSTLILTTSANRRSFYTYFQTQAQYAAQAGLDAVTNAAYSDKAFSEWVAGLADGEVGEVTLDYGTGTNIPLTKDITEPVTCRVEKCDPLYIWDDDSQRIHKRDAWKITVSASVGTGRNAAVWSTCNYIYSNYVGESEAVGFNNTAEWKNVSSINEKPDGTIKKNKIINPSNGVTNNAVLTFSTFRADGGYGNNMLCLGPMTANINTIPAGRTKYGDGADNSTRNDTVTVGNILLVGGFNVVTHQTVVFQKPGEGMIIYGNLLNTNELYVYNETSPRAEYYKDIPYVYVDGTIKKGQPKMIFGNSPKNGSAEQPVNVYCNALEVTTDGFEVNGDLFIYDPEQESVYTPQNSSKLAAFAYNNVKKANYSTDGYQAGDLICNNKKLTIGKVSLDGDLIMTNPKSELVITDNITVNGSIVIAGKVSSTKKVNITANGGIYVYPAQAGGLDSNINDFTEFNNSCAGYTVLETTKTIQNSATAATIESLNLDATGTNYNDLVTKILTNVTVGYTDVKDYVNTDYFTDSGYDFRLFPFCYRQDEIFETYYRWDLASQNKPQVDDAIQTDKLILESRACGHIWGVEEKEFGTSEGGGTIWVPFTHPVQPDSNKFIAQLNTVDPSNLASSQHYYNDIDAFEHDFGITEAATKTANTTKASVVFPSHTADATEGETCSINSNCYVIDKSCTVNLGDFQTNNETVTIFINPYHFTTDADGNQTMDDDLPLGVSFRGTISNTQLRIVVNNTCYYKTKSGAAGNIDYTTYTELNSDYAGRADVALFFDNGVNIMGNDSYIGTTGSYKQCVDTHDINVVSNPVYPSDAGWSKLGGTEKYKYQMVPNFVIYSQKGGTVKFEKIPFFNAAVIMPDSTIATQASTSKKPNELLYREENNSLPYETGKRDTSMYDVDCIGSMAVGDFQAQNLPICVYLGDLNRPGEEEHEEETKWKDEDETTDKSDAWSRRTTKGGDYFSNDHQDAN